MQPQLLYRHLQKMCVGISKRKLYWWNISKKLFGAGERELSFISNQDLSCDWLRLFYKESLRTEFNGQIKIFTSLLDYWYQTQER